MRPKLSFVLPCKNESENIPLLYKELKEVLDNIGKSYEIIFVDDGSTDDIWEVIGRLRKTDNNIFGIRHRGNFGKSIALANGFSKSRGEIIFTLDADLQDDPSEIPNFLNQFDKGFDVVIGWKQNRHDPLTKLLSSWLFNWAVRILTQTQFHDINCGYKAYKREVITNMDFGELFRFIPILAVKQHYKVKEMVVHHRPRKFGKSKFGFERAIQGGLDLITVIFLTRFARRPSQFFGLLGLTSSFAGFLIGLYITYLRFTTGGIDYHYPLLSLGVLLIIMGVQFISTGLLAEMIVRLGPASSKDTISSSIS